MNTAIRSILTSLAVAGLLNLPAAVLADEQAVALEQSLRAEQLQELRINVRASLLPETGLETARTEDRSAPDEIRDYNIEIIHLPQKRVSFSP